MLTIELPAVMDNLRLFQQKAAEEAQTADFSPKGILNLELVLEELLTNVIKHAHKAGEDDSVLVALEARAGEINVRIEDRGEPFNLLEAAQPDTSGSLEERPIGGLGIYLVRKLTDSLTYSRVGDRNVVEFVMKDSV